MANHTKKFEVTDEDRMAVCAMVMHGLPRVAIAKVMKMSNGSLYNYFREELEHGDEILGGKLASTLVQKALDGDKASLFFVMKTKYGYRETNRYEHTGVDGGPIQSEHAHLSVRTIDPSKLSPQTRMAILEQLEAEDAAKSLPEGA